ncbi:hypothetical protein C8J55DRAFT_516610 [Lentinula edodes]|uniref:MYND-type domain-containing protein n=1 Tax=Lentinula lateritia TaxID=40482 RepID=A0A9W9A8L2_9AGAR|nr:hypothetical protein C8J55DRAFT_516610 [Lentinula edodes]
MALAVALSKDFSWTVSFSNFKYICSVVFATSLNLPIQMPDMNVPELFRLLNRQPPIIDRRRPLGPEVLRMIEALKCFTRHLLKISSFQTRYDIVESKWPQIWSWLKALLHPVLTDAQLDPPYDTSQYVLTVFSFLNSVIPPSTPIVGLQKFVLELFNSPETITILGKVWVFFFTLQWPSSVHQATTQFLVVFSRIIDCTPCEIDFRIAVYSACSSSNIFPTWSAATLEVCTQQWSLLGSESQLITASRGLLLAVTTLLFQPLPALHEVDKILSLVCRLWHRCVETSPLPRYHSNLHFLSIHFLARFLLRLTQGGSNWVVKVLNANLVYLLAKASAWMNSQLSLDSISSIHTVFEELMHQLLVSSVYRSVVCGIRLNMKTVHSQHLEDHLGTGRLRELWADLRSEAYGARARSAQIVCLRKGLELICSNKDCPDQCLSGKRSAVCGRCRSTSYCSKLCQRQDWLTGHRTVCAHISATRPIHPIDQHRLQKVPVPLGDLERFQLLLRALLQAKARCDEIRQSIIAQKLENSQIVIEFDLTSYPWSWNILHQASSVMLREFPHYIGKFDTVIGVICPQNTIYSDYIARPVRRAALLDPTLQFVYESADGVLCNLYDVLLRF